MLGVRSPILKGGFYRKTRRKASDISKKIKNVEFVMGFIFLPPTLPPTVLPKQEKHVYAAKCEDGRLFYEGDWYSKGQSIILEMKDETPAQ